MVTSTYYAVWRNAAVTWIKPRSFEVCCTLAVAARYSQGRSMVTRRDRGATSILPWGEEPHVVELRLSDLTASGRRVFPAELAWRPRGRTCAPLKNRLP